MVDVGRSQHQRPDSTENERPRDRYQVYRQAGSMPSVSSQDVLLGSYTSCDEALDACDADVVRQLADHCGLQRDTAHLIAIHSPDEGTSYHPMIAHVGGPRVLNGEALEAALLDTERWLRSQRLD